MAKTIGRTRTSKWEDAQNLLSKSSLEAAAEAAAKVNAMLIAKGKLRPSKISQQQNIRSKTVGVLPANLMVAEVEINDVPIGCRNLLTRGSTQDEISKFSGAAVSTRGRYMTAVDRMRNTGERPLYLCVQGPNQECVDLAVKRINEIITNGSKHRNTRFSPAIPPPGLPGPRPHMLNQPPPLMSINAQPTGLAFVQEKLFIGLEHAPPNFDAKNKLLGPGGCYLQHIQNETAAKVTLRGKSSGFLEPTSGREAFEPMHIHLQHSNMMGLQQAKQLAENLILTVQQDYAQFQQAIAAMPPTISPGTASLLAGTQHPTSVPLTMLPHQQGTFSSLGQAPMQHIQGVPGGPGLLPNSTISTVLLTTSIPSSMASMASPTFLSQANGDAGPQLVLTMPAPIATPGLGGFSGPPPGHVLVGQPQLGPHVAQVSLPGPLVTQMAPPPGVQLVSQPTLQTVQQQPPQPVQTFFTQIPPNSVGQPVSVSGPPIMSSVSSAGHTISSSGYSYSSPVTGQEDLAGPQKRRFREEKEDDKVPDNLLGYQHGPPHLTNLVNGPPPPMAPGQTVNLQLHGMPPHHLHMEERPGPVLVDQQGLMMPPPPPPSNMDRPPDLDKQLMPPPPLPMHGNKRVHPNGEPDRKRIKGALGEVAMYGSDEEVDEEGGSNSPGQLREGLKGHPGSQFSPPVGQQINFTQPLQIQPQSHQFAQPPNFSQGPPLEQFPGQLPPHGTQHPPPQMYIHQQISTGPPPPQGVQQFQPPHQLQHFTIGPPTSQSPSPFQQFSPTQAAGTQFIQRGITEQQQFLQPFHQLSAPPQPSPPVSTHPSQFNGQTQQLLSQPYVGQPPPQQSASPPQFQTAPQGMSFWVTQN